MEKAGAIRSISLLLVCICCCLVLFCVCAENTFAEETDCSMCHPDLAKKKTVHAAVLMGCTGCHTSLNVAEMPHKVTGKVPKGLSSAQPELCYGCHDKSKFTKKNLHAALQMGCTTCHNPHATDTQKLLVADMPGLCLNCHDKGKFENKTVHAALAMGCIGCHNPHSSDNSKLLTADVPDVCFNCHDKAVFSKKNIHSPVMGGMCLGCHSPHATEEMALLLKRPTAVCADCHDKILKERHVTGEFRHPVGSIDKPEMQPVEKAEKKKSSRKSKKTIMDPVRPEKEFYCGSCHNPHSSEWKNLLRYKANVPFDLCVNCHQK
jgi:predicted CXXCH cytochrome family protein